LRGAIGERGFDAVAQNGERGRSHRRLLATVPQRTSRAIAAPSRSSSSTA